MTVKTSQKSTQTLQSRLFNMLFIFMLYSFIYSNYNIQIVCKYIS